MLFIGDSTMRCALAFASLCLARAERCEPLPNTLTSRLLAIARGRSVRRTRARAATRSHVDARCSAYTCGSCDLHQRPRAPRPLTPISCAQNQSIVNERTFATWPDFFNRTTIDVAPFGHCECYRVASGGALFFENRSVMTHCSASRPLFAPPSRRLLSGQSALTSPISLRRVGTLSCRPRATSASRMFMWAPTLAPCTGTGCLVTATSGGAFRRSKRLPIHRDGMGPCTTRCGRWCRRCIRRTLC